MTESAGKQLLGPTRSASPDLVTVVVFMLLFSGPPMFRIRDPGASLEGAIDYVVILRLLVMIAGGLWILYQWKKQSGEERRHLPFKLRLPQKLGLAVVGCLSLSVFVSTAPALSAYKVCEMLVSLAFTATFVEIYGIEECLNNIFRASTILCVVIAVCVFVAPDLVLFPTETGAARLRGELIAPTEIVAMFGLILLLARPKKPSIIWILLLLAFFGSLVAFSLSRTAYVILAVFFGVYFWKLRKKFYAYSAVAIVLIIFVFDLTPSLREYRDPESIFTLSDRVGLWAYLTGVTLQQSPWLGLGYYSGSRIYGPEYNEGLGGAHSMFFETFVGAGVLGLVALLLLCLVLAIYAAKLLERQASETAFTVFMMFVATLMFGSIGGDFGYACLGITFWSLSAMLPILHEYQKPSRAQASVRRLSLGSPSSG